MDECRRMSSAQLKNRIMPWLIAHRVPVCLFQNPKLQKLISSGNSAH